MLFLFLNDNKIKIEAYTLDVLFRREKKKHSKHEYVDFVLSVLFSFREEPHALTHKQIKSRQARESTNWQISLFLLCGDFFRFAFFYSSIVLWILVTNIWHRFIQQITLSNSHTFFCTISIQIEMNEQIYIFDTFPQFVRFSCKFK